MEGKFPDLRECRGKNGVEDEAVKFGKAQSRAGAWYQHNSFMRMESESLVIFTIAGTFPRV